nr:hypothetical protein [uncultured Sphingomonas sp.]
MNADERTPGQQGYGEQTSQQADGAKGQQQQIGQQQDGGTSTGQASYGNSGDTGSATLSQNSTSLGQESDIGQSGQGRDTGLFSGSDDDLGSSTGRTGIDGSMDQSGQSGTRPGSNEGGSTGRAGIEGSLDTQSDEGLSTGQATGQQASGNQNFADQGQGAMSEDLLGSDRDSGTTDIEVERSQGRESDIEGSSL